MFLLHARLKKIQSLEWSQHYSLIFQTLKGSSLRVCDGILLKFKLVQAFMVVLVACKNEDGSSKNEDTRVVTTFLPLYVYGDFSRRSRASNSSVTGRILPNFEPIQDVMVVPITCENKEEPIKNEGAREVTRFPHYNPMGVICCHRNQSSNPI